MRREYQEKKYRWGFRVSGFFVSIYYIWYIPILKTQAIIIYLPFRIVFMNDTAEFEKVVNSARLVFGFEFFLLLVVMIGNILVCSFGFLLI